MPSSARVERGRGGVFHGRIWHRWRTAIEVVIFVTAVFFLGWGADALAREGAEVLLARNIQHATGVAERPVVTVRGFAFVPQVVRGAYNEVDVSTQGITSGPLRIEHVDSQLFDVRVPFHDVLVQDIRRVGVGRSLEGVTLRYEDLNAYFAATGRPLQLAPAAEGEVSITGSVDVLGRQVQVNALVALSVADDTLRISPRQINTGSVNLDQASRLLLGQRLTLSVPLGTLPFGHQLTSVTASGDAIRLQAQGTAIIVQP
jgi:LmeA-like phospholipid-binding